MSEKKTNVLLCDFVNFSFWKKSNKETQNLHFVSSLCSKLPHKSSSTLPVLSHQDRVGSSHHFNCASSECFNPAATAALACCSSRGGGQRRSHAASANSAKCLLTELLRSSTTSTPVQYIVPRAVQSEPSRGEERKLVSEYSQLSRLSELQFA